jgi:glycine/sarcosine N-methyltransferase
MPTLSPEQFYDAVSEQYDAMTDFASRVAREAATLQPLLAQFRVRTAVDMGCGTGVHVLALASLGVRATGVDLSDRMLAHARAHAAESPDAAFVRGDFLTTFPSSLPSSDVILCLGNSLPHIESAIKLRAVLSHWKRHLSPGGHVIIQLLNYARILRERERIVAVHRDGPLTVLRFYDFTEPRITFNILTITDTAAGPQHALVSTPLTPFTAGDIADAARAAGCTAVELRSSLRLDPWSDDAKDVIVIAG